MFHLPIVHLSGAAIYIVYALILTGIIYYFVGPIIRGRRTDKKVFSNPTKKEKED